MGFYSADSFPDKSKAAAEFEKLIQALARLGLTLEVRNGENCSLLVFVKANNDRRFNNEVYRSRYRYQPGNT